jgi:hypothetical protein
MVNKKLYNENMPSLNKIREKNNNCKIKIKQNFKLIHNLKI